MPAKKAINIIILLLSSAVWYCCMGSGGGCNNNRCNGKPLIVICAVVPKAKGLYTSCDYGCGCLPAAQEPNAYAWCGHLYSHSLCGQEGTVRLERGM